MKKCKHGLKSRACPFCNHFPQGLIGDPQVVRAGDTYLIPITKPGADNLVWTAELLPPKLFITQRFVPSYARPATPHPSVDISELALQNGLMRKPDKSSPHEPSRCWYCANSYIGYGYGNLVCGKCDGYVCWCCGACLCGYGPTHRTPRLDAFPIPPHIRYLYTYIFKKFRKDQP